MTPIKVIEGFTGYPSGKRRDFVKGEEVEVPDADAALFVEKGHAKLVSPEVEKAAPRAAGNDKGSSKP